MSGDYIYFSSQNLDRLNSKTLEDSPNRLSPNPRNPAELNTPIKGSFVNYVVQAVNAPSSPHKGIPHVPVSAITVGIPADQRAGFHSIHQNSTGVFSWMSDEPPPDLFANSNSNSSPQNTGIVLKRSVNAARTIDHEQNLKNARDEALSYAHSKGIDAKHLGITVDSSNNSQMVVQTLQGNRVRGFIPKPNESVSLVEILKAHERYENFRTHHQAVVHHHDGYNSLNSSSSFDDTIHLSKGAHDINNQTNGFFIGRSPQRQDNSHETQHSKIASLLATNRNLSGIGPNLISNLTQSASKMQQQYQKLQQDKQIQQQSSLQQTKNLTSSLASFNPGLQNVFSPSSRFGAINGNDALVISAKESANAKINMFIQKDAEKFYLAAQKLGVSDASRLMTNSIDVDFQTQQQKSQQQSIGPEQRKLTMTELMFHKWPAYDAAINKLNTATQLVSTPALDPSKSRRELTLKESISPIKVSEEERKQFAVSERLTGVAEKFVDKHSQIKCGNRFFHLDMSQCPTCVTLKKICGIHLKLSEAQALGINVPIVNGTPDFDAVPHFNKHLEFSNDYIGDDSLLIQIMNRSNKNNSPHLYNEAEAARKHQNTMYGRTVRAIKQVDSQQINGGGLDINSQSAKGGGMIGRNNTQSGSNISSTNPPGNNMFVSEGILKRDHIGVPAPFEGGNRFNDIDKEPSSNNYLQPPSSERKFKLNEPFTADNSPNRNELFS